jgi:hypothetical protein
MPPKSTNKVSAGRANATTKPAQAPITQTKTQATRAPQQFRGTAVGTGSRVPESAIRGGDEAFGKTSQERSFNQHYGVLSPIASGDFKVSQLQGNVPQRINYAYGAHTGVDFAAPVGTEVRGMREGGVVKFAGNSGAYGNRVVIEYPDGTQSAFNHLDSADVTPGQRVEKGQVFAKSGNTGRSTGAHLDLQSIDKNNVAAAPDKVFNKTSIYGASQFDDSWKGAQSGVNDFKANIGQSPTGGGTIMASGSENSGSRSDSFGTGISTFGAGSAGQQVNLGALNQVSMRKTGSARAVGATSPSKTSTEFTPAQTTNPGTTTSIKGA